MRLSSAAEANDGDEGDDGDDDNNGAAHPVYPGLQFFASQHTDRIYLYSKVRRPVRAFFDIGSRLDSGLLMRPEMFC